MDFQAKNFTYTTKTFGDFIDQVDRGERLYLRSLSAEKPAELSADIARDFPSISKDFQLPPELALVTENAHSCPLRISGPVIMWLHYDVSSCRGLLSLLILIRSWPMYYAKSEARNTSSYSLLPTSSTLDSMLAPRVRASMCLPRKVRFPPIPIRTKQFSAPETYSSYRLSGFTPHHQRPA